MYQMHLNFPIQSALIRTSRKGTTLFSDRDGFLIPWVPEVFFFFSYVIPGIIVRVSGSLSNREHGLFHNWYFENGPLEPGKLFGADGFIISHCF